MFEISFGSVLNQLEAFQASCGHKKKLRVEINFQFEKRNIRVVAAFYRTDVEEFMDDLWCVLIRGMGHRGSTLPDNNWFKS